MLTAAFSQVMDIADAQTPSQPIYLEASSDGKPMYEKIGFVVEGDVNSEYPEMVRWNADGRRREQ
jgi:predicted GNAT family N-acyltransferase